MNWQNKNTHEELSFEMRKKAFKSYMCFSGSTSSAGSMSAELSRKIILEHSLPANFIFNHSWRREVVITNKHFADLVNKQLTQFELGYHISDVISEVVLS